MSESKMSTMRSCRDCGVAPGEMHTPGCHNETCCLCGEQAIGCGCVYELNGMRESDLKKEHPDIYRNGPSEPMYERLEAEEAKYGGRLPWTGEHRPEALEACRRLGLWCYWDAGPSIVNVQDFGASGDSQASASENDSALKRAVAAAPRRGWVRCDKDHPEATEDLNRLPMVAHWDKNQRQWVSRHSGVRA